VDIHLLESVLLRWLPAQQSSAATASSVVSLRPVDVGRVLTLITELEPLLTQKKYDAISLFQELQKTTAGTELADEIDDAGRLLAEFRFDAMLDRLRQIVMTHGWEGRKS